MSTDIGHTPLPTAQRSIVGGGAMGADIRAYAWDTTSLGSLAEWPQSLRTAVQLMLNSRFAMFIWWGPELIYLYNDAYAPTLGIRHPQALGQPAAEVWAEIWPDIQPLVEAVVERGEATWNAELLLFLERSGFKEETYHTFSYSPILDESGRIGGLYCAVIEVSAEAISRRRMLTLRDLGERTLGAAQSATQAIATAAHTLQDNPYDLSFALVYLLEPDGNTAQLAAAVRLHGDPAPERVALGTPGDLWCFAEVIAAGEGRTITDLATRVGQLPAGAWTDDWCRAAYVLPLNRAGGQGAPAGFLVVGLSPRLTFDTEYRGFLELVAGNIATGISNARVVEEERRRAAALAELDRAKTAFFANVSHEFRTPLTLMLGPLSNLMERGAAALAAEDQAELLTVQRNGQRLLKLVNTLLDFARIEAGRTQAVYAPTDLARLTEELASVFRSAVERAGLVLVVDCPSLPTPIYVDRAMWEQIVLNLLSNALKFTFTGAIEVRLRWEADQAVLTVRDSGIGIPTAELPRLFERFHRVSGAQGRTHEGTGIGLALVQELVRLHGGTLGVQSQPGVGTVFTVQIPSGAAHLPVAQVVAAQTGGAPRAAASFVEEALGWLPQESSALLAPAEPPLPGAPRILLADDNADMRAYIARLLHPTYAVEMVSDGLAALESIRLNPPDLVLTDIMMPRLDGFGLLRAVRGDDRLKLIPVVLLSARAGEEARVEGLAAGADDYLVKPFAARELLARIEGRLELARLRQSTTEELRTSEARLRLALHAARMVVWEWNPQVNQLTSTDMVETIFGTSMAQMVADGFTLIHPEDRDRHLGTVNQALADGRSYHSVFRIIRPDSGALVWLEERGYIVASTEYDGKRGLLGVTADITERITAEIQLKRSESEFRQLAASVPQLIWTADAQGQVNYLTTQWQEYTGIPPEQLYGTLWTSIVHPDDVGRSVAIWTEHVASGAPLELRHRFRHHTGEWRWQLVRGLPLRDDDGRIVKWFGTCTDVHEREVRDEDARMLAEVSEAIRLADEVEPLLISVTDRLGAYFALDRCFMAEIDEPRGTWLTRHDYRTDLPSLVGQHELSDFPDNLVTELRVGHLQISNDTATEPETAAYYQHAYAPLGVRACAVVPLHRDGHWVAVLAAVSATPRQWQPREVALLETIAERVWLAVERLRAAEALQRSEARLHQLYVREQAARLEAEEASRLKDEFLATVSHELRTPLTSILGYGHMLQSRQRDPEYIARTVEKIVRSAKTQAQLIEDLLDVSRIVSGKLQLEREPLDLTQVIAAAVDTVRPAIEAKDLVLVQQLDPAAAMIEGDANRLQQIIWNLLSNAVKFTPGGGTITIRLASAADTVALTVRDTGQGINPMFLPHVFDRFRQEESASTRVSGGLGLGLAIVRHLTEMHGGSVAVHSAGPGTGATFTVTLPRPVRAAAIPLAPPQTTVERCPPELSGLRVLVVDDNKDIAELIQFTLERCGSVVQTASSAAAGLALVQEWRPDLLISDIAMPQRDGYWLIEQVRALPGDAGGETLAVALTAYVRVEERTRVLEAGFQLYVPKPIEPDELCETLARLVGARH